MYELFIFYHIDPTLIITYLFFISKGVPPIKLYKQHWYTCRRAKMDTKETISKADWNKTPKTVKKLVKQLVGTLNVVVIPE
jgi:hypothetical protein